MTRLVPYDPNDNSGGSGKKPDSGRKEEKHYHYYDQRTFVQGDAPVEDDEPPFEAPAAKDSKVGTLLAGVGIGVIALGILAFIASPKSSTTDTTTNVMELNATEPAPVAMTQSTLDLLNAGDAAACAQTDIENTVIGVVQERIADYANQDVDADVIRVARSRMNYLVNAETLNGYNGNTHIMGCNASFAINNSLSTRKFGVNYTLQPAARGDDVVVRIQNTDEVMEAAAPSFVAAVQQVVSERDAQLQQRMQAQQEQEAQAAAQAQSQQQTPSSGSSADGTQPSDENP